MNLPVNPGVFDSGKIVRRASAEDIGAMMKLAAEISSVPRWPRASYATSCAIGEQAETQAKALFVCCVPAQDKTSSLEEIVGFAAFSVILNVGGGECELENMAVAESWRRQGIARRLLAAGELWCRAWCPAAPQGVSPNHGLSLEVRSSNLGAIAFYGRAGFNVNGWRPGYYEQPDDDAILMWKSLDAPL